MPGLRLPHSALRAVRRRGCDGNQASGRIAFENIQPFRDLLRAIARHIALTAA